MRDDEIDLLLKNLHLGKIREVLEDELKLAESKQVAYAEFLVRLLRAEWHGKQESASYVARPMARPAGCRCVPDGTRLARAAGRPWAGAGQDRGDGAGTGVVGRGCLPELHRSVPALARLRELKGSRPGPLCAT